MRISICLLTYKRPEQLAKLLQSIHQQSWAPAPQDMEIIIVDTSLGNAASEVVESYRERLPFEIRYDTCSNRRSTPSGRNRCVKLSRHELILFIDDDQYLEPDTLKKLKEFWMRMPAEVSGVKLSVKYVLPPGPAWLSAASYFNPSRPMDEERIPGSHMSTNGVLVKKSIFQELNTRFDESLGYSGGSDNVLFHEAEERGANFVSCSSIQIVEQTGPDRATIRYILRSSFRKGATFALLMARNKPFAHKVKYMIVSGIYLIGAMVLTVTALPFGRTRLLDRSATLCRQIGKIYAMSGGVYEIYR